MNKFLFKSTDADFKKMFSIIETMQKNILYITYHLDKCLVILRKQETDAGTQKQVDDFYETSQQTDTDDKEPD